MGEWVKRPPRRLRLAVGIATLLDVGLGRAAGPAGPAPIKNNGYSIEFFQGPVLAPGHVEALGGAYAAIAEGVEGTAVNAASPAVREPFSLKWFDFEPDVGVSFPGSFSNTDFDDHGPPAKGQSYDQVNDFIYVNLGVRLQFGAFGIALTGDLLTYGVTPPGGAGAGLSLISGRYHLLGAYALLGNQLIFGAGLRGVSLQLSEAGTPFNPVNETFSPNATLTMTGISPETGFLVKPDSLPVRFGSTIRAPVTGTTLSSQATTVDGVAKAGGLIVPNTITLPWELETGIAIQVGPRPLNPKWLNPHDEEAPVREAIEAERARRAKENEAILARASKEEKPGLRAELEKQDLEIRRVEDERLDAEYERLLAARKARFENWPREKILLVASALVTGESHDAVALEGFLAQQVESVGQRVTVSPRLGIEAEPIPNWLLARAGSYIEPSRFEGVSARQHFTFGGDAKLFPWNMFGITPGQVWRITGVLDVAPRYIDWGFSIGAWH
jgi:hypothetical protein